MDEERGKQMSSKDQLRNCAGKPTASKLPLWAAVAIIGLVAVAVVLLGLLAVSIMERRWEAQRPAMVLKPIAEWEPDNAKWGENYPYKVPLAWWIFLISGLLALVFAGLSISYQTIQAARQNPAKALRYE